MSSWWNGWGDTGQRLFVPAGGTVDNSNAPWWDIGGQIQKSTEQSNAQENQRKMLLWQQAAAAGQAADQAQQGYNNYGQQGQGALDYYRGQAQGQNSVSAEQLRQGLQQMYGQQASAAAGAAPRNQAMASRSAMRNMMFAGQGMAGQQAVAGLQERNQAMGQYGNLLQGLRGQDAQMTLGSRNAAMQGYGATDSGKQSPSAIESYGPAAVGVLGAILSDRALKTNVQPGNQAANAAITQLQPYTYAYKDQSLGAGPQVGVMAQDLERAGLGQAVINTPRGKAVDAGKLTGANTAMIASLGQRVAALEKEPQLYDIKGNPVPANASPDELRAARDRSALYQRWAQLETSDPQGARAQQALNMRRAELERMGPPQRDKFATAVPTFSDRLLKTNVQPGAMQANGAISALGWGNMAPQYSSPLAQQLAPVQNPLYTPAVQSVDPATRPMYRPSDAAIAAGQQERQDDTDTAQAKERRKHIGNALMSLAQVLGGSNR